MPARTILIVDSDSASLNYLTRILQEQRYFVSGTGSGREGISNAWQDQPDLIIIDPAFQDIPTAEFLQQIRQDSRSSNIPVLALSS